MENTLIKSFFQIPLELRAKTLRVSHTEIWHLFFHNFKVKKNGEPQ